MPDSLRQTPWRNLPAEVGAVLRPELSALAAETIAAIGRQVPEYARPLRGRFGRNLREGVELALGRFVDLVEGGSEDGTAGRQVYVDLGRLEQREGRSLDALQTAYRIGARLAWRRFVEAGRRAELEPEVLYVLAESIFAYVDGLAAESIEGYALAQSQAAGEHQRRRAALVEALAAAPPPPAGELSGLARAAGWPLAKAVCGLVVGAEDPGALAQLAPDVVAAVVDGQLIGFLADPVAPGRDAALMAAAGSLALTLGPPVPARQAHRSLARARMAHAARGERGSPLPAAGPLRADEHLTELIVLRDPALLAEHAARELAPFDTLTPAAATRLRDTLRVWLDHQGRIETTARRLEVHPQTVRYRLNQLRDLLGARLDEPAGRFALSLALRASHRSETTQ